MTAFEPSGIGESKVSDDGRSISITFETADAGLATFNLPVGLSGHLIRLLTARHREALEKLSKSGVKTEFFSAIADVKTLSIGGAKGYKHPIMSLETKDGVVASYQVPTNVMQRLAMGLTRLFAEARKQRAKMKR
jgi:hypothetical protein